MIEIEGKGCRSVSFSLFAQHIMIMESETRRRQVGNSSVSSHSNSTKRISNSNSNSNSYSNNRMDPSYSLQLPPQCRVSTISVDADLTDSYRDGFSPITSGSNNISRGSSIFASKNGTIKNVPVDSQHSLYKKKYNDPNGGEASGSSCLVIPSFGGNKKKKKRKKGRRTGNSNRIPSSSASASTSAESSAGDPFLNHENNDRQSLLKSFSMSSSSSSSLRARKTNGSTNSARDWYLETMVEEGDDDNDNSKNKNENEFHGVKNDRRGISDHQSRSQHQPHHPNQRRQSRQATDFDGFSSAEATPHLLKLPTAEDRGHQARRRKQRSSGQRHAYQGELEPEGVRGQEATVVTNTSVTSNSQKTTPLSLTHKQRQQQQQKQTPNGNLQPITPIRNFTNFLDSESSSRLPIHKVVSNRRANLRNSLLLNDSDVDDDEEEEEEENDDGSLNYHVNEQHQISPQQNNYVSNSIGSNYSSAGSNDVQKFLASPIPSELDFDEVVSHNLVEFSEDVEDDKESCSVPSRRLSRQEERHESAEEEIASSQQKAKYSITSTTKVPTIGSQTVLESSSSQKSFRRSAPVNVDDSSFEDPLEHIQGIHAMAMEHVMRGEFDMALQAFSQVLEVYIEQHGQAHPLTASAHHNLGTVHTKRAGLLPEYTLHQRHCREEALKCFQAAARSARDCPTLGPNHPNVAVSLVRIGFLLLQSRQYQNAVITFEEALRIRIDNFGPAHGLVANLYNNLGVCQMHMQHFPDGQKHLQQALDIQKKLLTNEEEDSSTALLELADTLCNIGGLNLEWIRRQGPDARHARDAESAFLEALRLRSKVLGKENPLTNQVRSLHDMVRSIPMPKGISAGGSFDSSPVAVSDITNSVAKSPSIHRNLIQKDRGIANSPSHSVSEELLSIPQLDLPTNNKSAMLPTHDTENQKLIMDGCEATEESCLLRRPADGDLPASQTSDFVTHARVAAVVMENNGSLNGETDRMATIRKAKAVLERNRDFMDSPVQHSTNNDESSLEKTTDERDGNLNEDGLIPLAGDWPGPTDKDKLSTEVLSNPNENLHTIHNCATNYLLTGRQSEAATLLEMVVECQKSKNGNLHEDVGSAVHNVGIAYLRMDENYTALEAFEEAVRVRKEALGREHPQVAVSLVKAGISLMLLQRHEDALWIFREALSVRKLALGDLHPSNARIYNNIGCVHVEFDELEDARKAFESALDIQRNALINNAENLPMIFGASTTLQNLGFLYGKRDMYEKAAMVLRESLSVRNSYI